MGSVETGAKHGFYAVLAGSAGAAAIGRSVWLFAFKPNKPEKQGAIPQWPKAGLCIVFLRKLMRR
jgi:hypothetical protein